MKLISKKEINIPIIINHKQIIIKETLFLLITDIRKILPKLTIIIMMIIVDKNM